MYSFHATVAVLTAVALVGGSTSAYPAPRAAKLPPAVVALGDSLMSGESAGAYEPGTDQRGNFCHRSTRNQLRRATLAGSPTVVNLACSGASTENVRLGGKPLYGEAPQAEQLRAVTRTHRVTTVLLTIGANDVGFVPLVVDCLRAYFRVGPRCQDIWTPKLPRVIPAMAPKVAAVLSDIRTVMKEAGYGEADYDLMLQSYPSPVTERNRYRFGKALHGCPIRDDDALWAREIFVPQVATALHEVAAGAGARFLDLRDAMVGHEVCARGITKAQEWVSGIRIDLRQLGTGAGRQLVQQSLHPNALGHAQLGRCLTAFAASAARAANCRGNGGIPRPFTARVPEQFGLSP